MKTALQMWDLQKSTLIVSNIAYVETLLTFGLSLRFEALRGHLASITTKQYLAHNNIATLLYSPWGKI